MSSNNHDQGGSDLEQSFIPREFFIKETHVIKPTHRPVGQFKSTCTGSSWETQLFPSLNPNRREEVDHLRETLKKMLDSSNLSPGQHVVAYTNTEWKVYNICFHELIRQVNTNCKNRAQLLAEIREHVDTMLQRLSNHIISVQEENTTLTEDIRLQKVMNLHLHTRHEEFRNERQNQDLMQLEEQESRKNERRFNPRRRSLLAHVGLMDDNYKYDFKVLDKDAQIHSQLRYHRHNAAARVIQRRYHIHQQEYFIRTVLRFKRQTQAANTIINAYRWHRDNTRRMFQSMLVKIVKQKEQRAYAILMIQKWVKRLRAQVRKRKPLEPLKSFTSPKKSLTRRNSEYPNASGGGGEAGANSPRFARRTSKIKPVLKFSAPVLRLTMLRNKLLSWMPESVAGGGSDQHRRRSSLNSSNKSELDIVIKSIEDIFTRLVAKYKQVEQEKAMLMKPTEPTNPRRSTRKSILTRGRTFKPRTGLTGDYVSLQRHIRHTHPSRNIKPMVWLKAIIHDVYQHVSLKHAEDCTALAITWNTTTDDLNLRFCLSFTILEWQKYRDYITQDQLNPDLAKGVFKCFHQKFGVRERVDQTVQDVIVSLTASRDSNIDVKTFGEFVSYERPAKDLSLYLYVRARAIELGGFIRSSKDGYPVDVIGMNVACQIGQELLRVEEQRLIVQTDREFYSGEFQCYLPERVLEQLVAFVSRLDRVESKDSRPTVVKQRATQSKRHSAMQIVELVSFNSFMQLLYRYAAEQSTRFMRFQWCRERFALVDANQDEFITVQEFQNALASTQPLPSNRELCSVYNQAVASAATKAMSYRSFLSTVWRMLRTGTTVLTSVYVATGGSTSDEAQENEEELRSSVKKFLGIALDYSTTQQQVVRFIQANHEHSDAIKMSTASKLLRLQGQLEQQFILPKYSKDAQIQATDTAARLFEAIKALVAATNTTAATTV